MTRRGEPSDTAGALLERDGARRRPTLAHRRLMQEPQLLDTQLPAPGTEHLGPVHRPGTSHEVSLTPAAPETGCFPNWWGRE